MHTHLTLISAEYFRFWRLNPNFSKTEQVTLSLKVILAVRKRKNIPCSKYVSVKLNKSVIFASTLLLKSALEITLSGNLTISAEVLMHRGKISGKSHCLMRLLFTAFQFGSTADIHSYF